MFEPTFNDEIEYVSVSRQKIEQMLTEWEQEIRQKRKEPLSEQAAQDIKREIHELMRISKILSGVSINPKAVLDVCSSVALSGTSTSTSDHTFAGSQSAFFPIADGSRGFFA